MHASAYLPGTAKPRFSLDRLGPIAAGVIAFVVGIWAFRPYAVGVFVDDGVYVILAKALATGHGLRNLHLPGTPYATHFPPGYPLLLAALWRVYPSFPKNIALFLVVQAVLLSLVALGTYAYARRVCGWRPAIALPVSLVATLSLPLMALGALVCSELLSLALLLPFLVAAERRCRESLSTRHAVLLGAYVGVIALVRTHLVLVMPAMCVVLASRRQWRAMLMFAGTTLCFVIPWQVWTAANAGGVQGLLRGYYGSYGAWFANGLRSQGMHLVTATLRLNAAQTWQVVAARVAPWSNAGFRLITGILALGAVVFGAFRMRSRAPITVLFAAAYVAVVLIWPFAPWRFIWGVWPIFVLLGTFGAAQAIEVVARSPNPRLGVVPALASALLVFGILRAESFTYRTRLWSVQTKQLEHYMAPFVQWVNGNTKPSDVLVADDEPLVYLFTGRQAMPETPFTAEQYVQPRTQSEEARALDDVLNRYRARYVVTVTPSTRAVARSIAAADSSRLHELRELPNGAAFEVR